jgi:anti-sigma factor RsiW
MAEKHPDELELLSFAEEQLDADARQAVAEHLVACRSCADQVRRLEAAREALRSAPLLELPGDRREAIMTSLPERRDPWRLFRPAQRALVIAAPVAAAAALVGVFVLGGTQLDGTGDNDEAGGDAAAEATMNQAERAEGGQEAAPLLDIPGATLVRTVQGPPAEIARLLEDEGITARVEPSGAVVAEGRVGDVRAALAGRAAGDVPVYVR